MTYRIAFYDDMLTEYKADIAKHQTAHILEAKSVCSDSGKSTSRLT